MQLSQLSHQRLLAVGLRRGLLCGMLASLVSCLVSCTNAPTNSAGPSTVVVGTSMSNTKPELLVERLSWGINTNSAQQVNKVGATAYLQQQLQLVPMPNSVTMPQAVQDQIAAMTISQKSLVEIAAELEQLKQASDANGASDDARKNYQQELNRLDKEAQSRAILRALYSPQQLQEQLCWFWFNHFNVFQGKANIRAMLGDYEEQAIRPHVLGHFRELLAATAHHPAMLRYLDNEQNAINHPNENYAREIMELHSMGVDGGYSQRDVQELARILTGVGFSFKNEDPPRLGKFQGQYVHQGLFEFNPRRHDYGDKQFLGHTIKGRGLAEVDEALTLLSRHPATAHFVSKKLALFFVGETPSPALVDSMAKTFLATDGDIKAVLSTLFASAEFNNSLGKQFKDPQHYVFSALRLAYDDKPILNTNPVIYWLSRLGQPRYGKLTPDGYPLTATAWDSPGQMTTRFEIAKAIGNGSAGLFKSDNGNESAGFPKLSNALYFNYLQSTLGPNTLKSLEQANSPQEWNTLLLAAPEMMVR
ncbi:DUF1800 domain-containing protein [Solimicrobium silvestre]|uniref:DUF1800 domain-containing protein n=1 Tax=Solimicrobium silvestre TaxID=2099400 RepID=A0A2S9H3H5_9BURK|nr:DUF1800 domain-containing protein [Solimicrobium silvestre]PRC94535.1 hypothetical protein S2091_0538 [Solimicrobium silvestre]